MPFFPQGQPEVNALLLALGIGNKNIVELDLHIRLASDEIAIMSLSYKAMVETEQMREVTQALQAFDISDSKAVEVVRDLTPDEKIKFREFL